MLGVEGAMMIREPAGMATPRSKKPDPYLLTYPLAALLAVAAACGVFLRGIYTDAPVWVAQAVGGDLVSLLVVLPALLVGAARGRRGSYRARLVWLGGLTYLVYMCAMYAFDVQFNALFLVYLALFGGSLYVLIWGLATLDPEPLRQAFAETTPVRTVAVFLALVATLFYFVELSEVIPAILAGTTPRSVLETGLPANPVHVMDMACLFPALGTAAVCLWRRRPLGYTLAGALLTFFVLLDLSLLSMALTMARWGFPVGTPQLVIFGLLLATCAGLLAWYRGSVTEPSIGGEASRRPRWSPARRPRAHPRV
jgi:hypothetical protein